MKLKSRADRFFTDKERERIKDTTCAAESKTIGEIAVMVVDSSDPYIEADVLGGVLLGSLLSFVLTALYFHSSVWFFVPLGVLSFFPARFLVKKTPFIKTAFIGLSRMENTVRERAVRAFYEKGLYRTKDNTGVLFFISLLERKVWVLADKGIYEKIEQKTLDKFAKAVSVGIRNGRACDALCEEIKEAGELLALHFPMKPGDIDELPNSVLCE